MALNQNVWWDFWSKLTGRMGIVWQGKFCNVQRGWSGKIAQKQQKQDSHFLRIGMFSANGRKSVKAILSVVLDIPKEESKKGKKQYIFEKPSFLGQEPFLEKSFSCPEQLNVFNGILSSFGQTVNQLFFTNIYPNGPIGN